MKKINIGIDLGPTSVAIAMIDENGCPVDKPVIRLFADACDNKTGKPNNLDRRAKRHIRRSISRKLVRRKDAIKLFSKFYGKSNEDIEKCLKLNTKNIIALKVNGLANKLSVNDQIVCLFHYLKHRGHFFSFKFPDKFIYPSQRQLEFYKKNGFWRNNEFTSQFSNKEWQAEIKCFFSIQQLSSVFLNEYLELFTRKRLYVYGPGSYKSTSPYGLQKDDFSSKGIPIRNLWDKLIGKCTFLSDQPRCLKKTTSFELISLLEKLNNLTYVDQNGERNFLNKYLKNLYLNQLFNGQKNSLNNLRESIAKFQQVKKKEIYFINREGKVLNSKEDPIKNLNLDHTFFCCKLFNKFPLNKGSINWDTIELFDNLANLINKSFHEDSIIKNVVKIPEDFSNEFEKVTNLNFNQHETMFQNHLNENIKNYFGVSRVSLKAIKIAMQNFLDNDKENWSSLKSQGIFDQKQQNFNDMYKWSIRNIGSPSVQKAIVQFFALFNELWKKKILNKYLISTINIEMAKERNSLETQKQIAQGQKFYENHYKEIKEELEQKKINPHLGQVIQKLYLYGVQDGKDPYTGEPLDRDKVYQDTNYVDIDHIYAYSWSADDSLANKIITLKCNNRSKGNNTVATYLGEKQEHLQEHLKENVWKKFSRENEGEERINRLSNTEKDSNKFGGFIGRNLSDLRYITSIIYDLLKEWVKFKKIEDKPKINTVNGKFTRYIDKFLCSNDQKFRYLKNRDEYKHHGVDAIEVAYAAFVTQQIQSYIVKNNFQSEAINVQLNDKWYEDIKKKVNDAKLINYVNNSNNFDFSIPVIKKRTNRLHDETLYSAKNLNGTNLYFDNINIMTLVKDKIHKYFLTDSCRQLCIFHNDKILFECLKKIVSENDEGKENHFVAYMEKIYNTDQPMYLFLDKKYCDINRDIKIKTLKCATKIKDLSEIYINPKQQHENNKKFSIYKSLEWKKIMVYKVNEQFLFIPLNCLYYRITHINHGKDKNKNLISLNYDKILEKISKESGYPIKKDISPAKQKELINSMFKFSLYKNDIVNNGDYTSSKINEKNQYYRINGFNGSIEIKPINMRYDGQIFVTPRAFSKYFSVFNSNLFGQKYLDKKRIFN